MVWAVGVALSALSCGGAARPGASEPAASEPVAGGAEGAAAAPAGDGDEEHARLREAIVRQEQRIQMLTERVDRLAERLDQQAEAAHRADAAADRAAVGAGRQARPGPDAAAVYAVPIAGAPFRGAKSAPVTVVRSFEFACPYSHRTNATMDQLLADYGNDIKIVYRDFVVHPRHATVPARAACAARRQGKYFQMHDLIWTRAWEGGRDFSAEHMERLAGELGLDMKRWRKDLDGACADELRAGQEELTRLGQSGTPTFWINGRYLSGARPIEQFKEIIEQELALAKERIGKKGTTRASYYKKWVLGKGKKKVE